MQLFQIKKIYYAKLQQANLSDKEVCLVKNLKKIKYIIIIKIIIIKIIIKIIIIINYYYYKNFKYKSMEYTFIFYQRMKKTFLRIFTL